MTAGARPPIRDYALLSDCQGSALVSKGGSIDWACLPRFDSPSTFGRLIGTGAGHWELTATDDAEVERSYLEGTLVLCTTVRTASGTATITDAMPFAHNARGHQIGHDSPHAVVRLVEGVEGTVELGSEWAPRPEYGLTTPRWTPIDGGAVSRGGPSANVVSCPFPLEIDGGTARARFSVKAGQRVGLALRTCDPWAQPPVTWSTDQVRAWLHGTIEGWRSWAAQHQSYEGAYSELVHHSGRVLQGLTFAPTGAIVAAPTTSLPEAIGGDRNWDYRYAWVRDTSLTLLALWVAACPDEVADTFGFFVTAAGSTSGADDAVSILYGVGGERQIFEHEIDHLDGYHGSRPVRVGNGAWRQTQLDVYGEILDAAALFADRVDDFDDATSAFLVELADNALARWEETDRGIWEVRGDPQHFVYSKLMCWVALDRAIILADALDADAERIDGWTQGRAAIHDAICERGWSDSASAFTQAFDSDELDAAALMISIVGFLPPDDERVRATVDAVRTKLTDDHGLVFRYRAEDGLSGTEATFGICTYWLAHALALAGDVEGARHHFEAITDLANDVGLLSEEVDGGTGDLLGNFPQALSHIGLVNAAHAITEAEKRSARSG